MEFFDVGGSRSARTLHYFALLFLGGLFFFWWGGGSGGLITFLAGCLTRYSLGLAATLSTLLSHCTLKIADIRKERWPSQNEPRCAINDPAMDVASNNFAVFSQRIDVTPCRSDEETSWLSITASSTETNSLGALQNHLKTCISPCNYEMKPL